MTSSCWKRTGVNSSAALAPGEFLITNQDGVRLDLDKDRKVRNESRLLSQQAAQLNDQAHSVLIVQETPVLQLFGDLALSSHRVIWSKAGYDHDLNLSLSAVLLVEAEEGGLMSSDKISLTVVDQAGGGGGRQSVSKLVFKQGGQKPFIKKLHDALAMRQWEVKVRRTNVKDILSRVQSSNFSYKTILLQSFQTFLKADHCCRSMG